MTNEVTLDAEAQRWHERWLERGKEIERLRETLNHPRLTMTAPVEQIKAVLHDWEKGREVNGQDLINALAWRVGNQRRELARRNAQIQRVRDCLASLKDAGAASIIYSALAETSAVEPTD